MVKKHAKPLAKPLITSIQEHIMFLKVIKQLAMLVVKQIGVKQF